MSSSNANPLAALHQAAEAVRQQLQAAAFDAAAVQRLADFIDTQRPLVKPEDQQGVVTALGCFLGECLVQTFHGQWAAGPDGSTGVGIQGQHFFNPFFLVDQQFKQGAPANVAAFFASVPNRISEKVQRNSWIKY